MSLGLMFAGQGTQHPNMLPWLDEADPLVQRTLAMLGITDWRLSLGDADWAVGNRQAQVLLTGLDLAAWNQLAARLPAPAAIAGYSVGELAAFSAAGVFDATTALDLAVLRAQAMDLCARQAPGGLLSVSGLSRSVVDALCEGAGVGVAIDIDEETRVVGGPADRLGALASRASDLGAKVGRLGVSVASHTPSMQPAAEAFAAELARVKRHAPRLPLFSNATGGRINDGAQATRVLAQQIARTVRWSDVLEAMHARRPACVLEIGPGSALASMWNRRFPDVPARAADEFRSSDALVRWVDRHMP
ncbi:acyltransferase domain-containing protein [Leptothrix discophora]|uniref:Acyltransferase domain-containing protein n=1 Tax=Leptothrix discophora TaxID=89 RepID=A0ABT9G1S5_LEPDI|nr:acyltransferase domain-containing protein [Leptothrix discophora]MDP4300417.1 acyltransferase domain-containing protein [Leptothrix discophora]